MGLWTAPRWKEVKSMIPVVIDTLVIGTPPSPSVIVLRPLGDPTKVENVLPIWIGPTEAASIGMALQGQDTERPMTHDLFTSLLDVADTELRYVVINRVEETTFFAMVVLEHEGQRSSLDARPSDSIALAVREKAPIYVDETVMEMAAFPAALNPGASEQIEVQEFHEFIEAVNPEDFKV